MNHRICSIALVGGLILLFCIPLSAKTLYVATNGDNSTGESWETAYLTINAAVTAAQLGAVTDPNAVTIIVGSAGTGHGLGTYNENIDISLPSLTLESESGYESTIIHAAAATDYVIDITADYVTIRGFSIYGAATSGLNQYSAIALNGADSCLLEKNRCGWDSVTYKNARGISLAYSENNTIRNNLCRWNTNSGIYLTNSSKNNVITQNTISHNGNYGIEMTSTSNYNSITMNHLYNNTNDSFYLNSVDFNQIVANSTSGNRFGFYGLYSEDNSLYLNDFRNNNSSSFYAKYIPNSSGDYWASPTPLCYAFRRLIHSSYMGNLYEEYSGSDLDSDGIGDIVHPIKDGVVDPAPLTDPNFSYVPQVWYLASQETMTMDPNQAGAWQTLASGGSYVWLSNTAARNTISFTATEDGWHGQVRFNTSTASNFEIEIGYANPHDRIFVGSGATATLSGTSNIFTFETTGHTFFVEAGMALAFQITNHGSERQLYVGGAWSYISAPSGTDTAWPGVSEIPPEPPANPGNIDGIGGVDMGDMATLSARWGLTDCNELNDYCDRADIDKTGDVGLGDLMLLATYWLMGPDDLLGGDWNEDFKVDMEDAAILSGQWTSDLNQLIELCENWMKGVPLPIVPTEVLSGDWNKDSKVNMDDMAILSGQWTGDLDQLVPLCENWLQGVF